MPHAAAPRTQGRVIVWAARYDLLAWLLTHGKERQLRERFVGLARLERGESVLDVGCGTGTLAIAAARRAGPDRVHGIDPSPAMIARARRKTARADVDVEFTVGVAERLPFPDARFDVVLSTLMLHHLPRTTRRECVSEIARVLKAGGRVLAVDFGRGNGRGLLAHLHRHGHVDVTEIAALLEGAGLAVTETGPVGLNNLHFVLATNASA